METNESMGALFAALAKAQGQPPIESRHLQGAIIPKMLRAAGRHYRTNQETKLSVFELFMRKVAFGSSDCWYWTGCMDKGGYGRTGPVGGHTFAHRVAWHFFRGDVPPGMKVLHRCDVRNCVNPGHLFIGTQADNVADMVAKGRARFRDPQFGEDNPGSRLTAKQVEEIRKEYALCKTPMKALAAKHGVSTMTVCRAINRQTWSR